MSQNDRYRLVARVASSSNPRKAYEIKWDGHQLTCPCRGWVTMARGLDSQGHRGCRHTDEVNTLLNTAHMTAAQAAAQLAALPGGLQGVALAAQTDPVVSEVNAICRRHSLSGTAYAVLRADIEGAIRKFAGEFAGAGQSVRYPGVAGSVPRPDWLGGGRAIILRD